MFTPPFIDLRDQFLGSEPVEELEPLDQTLTGIQKHASLNL